MEVGNTPLVHIGGRIYAKNESVNPGGSVKDRPVKYILDRMNPQPGETVVEATSGNTGISLAMMCAERGLKCIIVMPCNMSEERKTLLRMFGAELVEVDAGNFDQAIQMKDDLVKEMGYRSLHQFTNKLNIECHRTQIFEEMLEQRPRQYEGLKRRVSAFVAGTGTGGTLMGVQQGFAEIGFNTKIIAVEPAESAVMSGGEAGLHGIEGIGDGSKFLVDLDKVDEVMTISTNDAKERARRLCKDKGLFVGVSSGANVLAAERYAERNDADDGIIFTILCDRGERYCSVL